MAAGDLTVTLIGTYATIALAIAAMTAQNTALVTDTVNLVVVPQAHGVTYFVYKYVRAAA